MTAVPKSLFIKSVDDYASRHLKHTRPANIVQVRAEGLYEILRVAEGLLVSPKLTLKVYGENVVLAHLITVMGLKTVEQLLKEKAIEFILWDQIITYTSEPQMLSRGMFPLQSGTLTSSHNIDPFESAWLGLRWVNPPLLRSDKRRIARLAAKHTFRPRPNLCHEAVQVVTRAYKQGSLAPLGFSAEVEFKDLSNDALKQFSGLAEQALEVSALVDKGLDLYQGQDLWQIYQQLFAVIPTPDQVFQTVSSVLALERIPAIPTLLLKNVLDIRDLPKIRNLPEAKEFRQWLWSQDSVHDNNSVSEAYLPP